MSYQLQPLRFATGKRVQRLAESQITKSDLFEHFKSGRNFRTAIATAFGKKLDGFADREFKNIMNGFSVEAHLEHVWLETFAFAFGAAHVEIAQKLHLDLFVSCARATFATAVAGVKRKPACRQSLRQCFRLCGE